MTTNARRGKDAERRLAKVIGGKRNPNIGGPQADVETVWAAYELKSRKTLPGWLLHGMAQAEAHAVTTGKVGVLVIEWRVHGHAQRWYAVDEKTWQGLHGEDGQIVYEELRE